MAADMNLAGPGPLLGGDDPYPVEIARPDGKSPFFLTCEHAGREIPQRLGDLGLHEREFDRHIAWDIGAAKVARGLSARLDAALIMQNYSRLVVDCNRSPRHHDFIPTVSEYTEIPGNRDLNSDEVSARTDEIYHPYHDSIMEALDRRDDDRRVSVLVAVHSFTPLFKDVARPWHVGLLFNRDERLAQILRAKMNGNPDLCIGMNEPYAISDETDYTLPVHGERRGIPHIEFEIRQDLIETEHDQRQWAEYLADWLLGCNNFLDTLVVHR